MSKSQVIITGFDPVGPFAGLLLPFQFLKRQNETRFKQEWHLTITQYLQLMREFVGPRQQRGSIQMGAAGSMSVVGGVFGLVVVNAHAFESLATSGTALSGVEFQTNGEMYETQDPGADVQQDGEWWSAEPITGIGNINEVRALSSGKVGTWSNAAASDDAWITINSAREWNVTKGAPVGSKSASATFEVGPDGVESADDSATISCLADFDDS